MTGNYAERKRYHAKNGRHKFCFEDTSVTSYPQQTTLIWFSIYEINQHIKHTYIITWNLHHLQPPKSKDFQSKKLWCVFLQQNKWHENKSRLEVITSQLWVLPKWSLDLGAHERPNLGDGRRQVYLCQVNICLLVTVYIYFMYVILYIYIYIWYLLCISVAISDYTHISYIYMYIIIQMFFSQFPSCLENIQQWFLDPSPTSLKLILPTFLPLKVFDPSLTAWLIRI